MLFTKYQGLSNDFIVVAAGSLSNPPDDARRYCDRRLGIGADGVLEVGEDPEGRATMRVWNSDGSLAAMCGNGLRCVAIHLFRDGRVPMRQWFEVVVEDQAMKCQVLGVQDVAALLPLPISGPSKRKVELSTGSVDGWFVDLGNPHFVHFLKAHDAWSAAGALGEELATHSTFSDGVNAGLAWVDDQGAVQLKVRERGAGYTAACGTGACASVVAGIEAGMLSRDNEVGVFLPGGMLKIALRSDAIQMTGPAKMVFEGRVE